jgi:hypothetical protein
MNEWDVWTRDTTYDDLAGDIGFEKASLSGAFSEFLDDLGLRRNPVVQVVRHQSVRVGIAYRAEPGPRVEVMPTCCPRA